MSLRALDIELQEVVSVVRDWSLVQGGGGATKGGGGGHVKFYPYKKRGWKKF